MGYDCNSRLISLRLMFSCGPFKCYVMQLGWEVRGCQISVKKRYEDVQFNVISVARGWVGFKFPEKNIT